jgi:hypothetical protein
MPNIPTANNNPGDLHDPSTGAFQNFSNPGQGFAALLNDLQNKIKGNTKTGLNGNSTLMDFAAKWAPDSDGNNSGNYAANLANSLGVRPDAKLSDLQSRLPDFANAVAKHEGWQGEFLPSSGNKNQSSGNSPVTPPSNNPPQVTTPNTNTPVDATNPGIITGNVLSGAVGGTEGLAAASGARAIQATPNVIKGVGEGLSSPEFWQNLGGALAQAAQLHFKNAGADLNKQNINAPNVSQANQIMASPIMGQKTVEGQSNAENVESAAGGLLQLLGIKYAPSLNKGVNNLSKAILPEAAQKLIPQGVLGKLIEGKVLQKSGLLQKLMSDL